MLYKLLKLTVLVRELQYEWMFSDVIFNAFYLLCGKILSCPTGRVNWIPIGSPPHVDGYNYKGIKDESFPAETKQASRK